MKGRLSKKVVLSHGLIGAIAGGLYAPLWMLASPLGLLILNLPGLAILGGGIFSCLLERSRKENQEAKAWLVSFLNAFVGGALVLVVLGAFGYDLKKMSPDYAGILYLTGLLSATFIAYALANGLRLLSDEALIDL